MSAYGPTLIERLAAAEEENQKLRVENQQAKGLLNLQAYRDIRPASSSAAAGTITSANAEQEYRKITDARARQDFRDKYAVELGLK